MLWWAFVEHNLDPNWHSTACPGDTCCTCRRRIGISYHTFDNPIRNQGHWKGKCVKDEKGGECHSRMEKHIKSESDICTYHNRHSERGVNGSVTNVAIIKLKQKQAL